jgi:hypothetical protein
MYKEKFIKDKFIKDKCIYKSMGGIIWGYFDVATLVLIGLV